MAMHYNVGANTAHIIGRGKYRTAQMFDGGKF